MPAESTRSPWPRWLLPTAVVGVALLLVVLILSMDSTEGTPAANEPAATPPEVATQDAPTEVEGPEQPDLRGIERRDEADLLTAGPTDAPVALVIFSDYQCPYCAKWSTETLPAMLERADAGDLRIEWRDVNIFGAASERAARASYAAAMQGAFWEYHAALFPDGDTRSERQLGDEALIALAGELGLDTARFAVDLDSEETAAQIAANAQFGLDLGAHSTPAFILGGQPIMGAQPTEIFLDALDDALSAAG